MLQSQDHNTILLTFQTHRIFQVLISFGILTLLSEGSFPLPFLLFIYVHEKRHHLREVK